MSARFGRDGAEFARVVNVSDGVFAIAMTESRVKEATNEANR
jgi:hypothetical protein